MATFVQRVDLGGANGSVAVKDSIDIAGLATKLGSRAFDKVAPAREHADVIQAVLDAGCHVVGKTNMHELAFGMTGVNGWTGTPLNPHYPDLIPGGSSSGSAVAVAAKQVDFALGTDTGGSVRVPAACCGVYGLKPTMGRVSRRGVWPAETTLDCVGPFANSIEMLTHAMTVIDPSFKPLSGLNEPKLGKVEVIVTQDVASTCDRFIEQTAMDVHHIQLDGMASAFQAAMTIINAETWAAYHRCLETDLLGTDVVKRLSQAGKVSPEDIAVAEEIRQRFSQQVDKALEGVSALVMPTLPAWPMTLEDALSGKTDLNISSLVRPFNLSGHPALSIPLVSANNRPVGLQLIGRKGDDEVLCELARQMKESDRGEQVRQT